MPSSPVSKPSKWAINMSFLKLMKLPRFRSKPKPDPSPNPNSSSPIRFNARNEETLDGNKYLEAFRHFDSDGDGKISSDEFSGYFARLGEPLPPDQACRVVNQFDSDGDCLLELEDFIRLVERENDEVGDDIKRAFEMYEADRGRGCITPESLQRTLGRLGIRILHEECVGMIRAFDLDGNGVVDLHEFQLMMT